MSADIPLALVGEVADACHEFVTAVMQRGSEAQVITALKALRDRVAELHQVLAELPPGGE